VVYDKYDPGKIEKSNPEKELTKERKKDFFDHISKRQNYNIGKNCNINFLFQWKNKSNRTFVESEK
jgi:hypothetical protein